MESLKKLVITKVESPSVVYSKKGKKFKMTNRKAFGLSLCIGGQITYEMNGKRFVSTKENCVLLPQGATYTLTGEKDGMFPLINFRCAEPVFDEITVIPLRDPQACIDRFELLNRQCVNGASRFQIFSTFYQLLGEIFREQEAIPDVLTAALEYIEQNLSRATLSNAEIARASMISEVYLRKLFARHLNTGPRQYILKLRLRQAKHLLTNTSFTVTAVAEQCGFSSVYYFSRLFKRETGLTPTQYARNNKIFKI